MPEEGEVYHAQSRARTHHVSSAGLLTVPSLLVHPAYRVCPRHSSRSPRPLRPAPALRLLRHCSHLPRPRVPPAVLPFRELRWGCQPSPKTKQRQRQPRTCSVGARARGMRERWREVRGRRRGAPRTRTTWNIEVVLALLPHISLALVQIPCMHLCRYMHRP